MDSDIGLYLALLQGCYSGLKYQLINYQSHILRDLLAGSRRSCMLLCQCVRQGIDLFLDRYCTEQGVGKFSSSTDLTCHMVLY